MPSSSPRPRPLPRLKKRLLAVVKKLSPAGSNDESLARKIAITGGCIKAVRGLAGFVPGLGPQIQALLDIGLRFLSIIEQLQTLKIAKSDLLYKILCAQEMLQSTLGHLHAREVPGLEEDLRKINEILQEVERLLESREDRFKLFRQILSYDSEYQTIMELGNKLEEAIKGLVVKSTLQIRVDVQVLKELTQRSVDSLQASLGTLKEISNSNKAALGKINSHLETTTRLASYVCSPKIDDVERFEKDARAG